MILVTFVVKLNITFLLFCLYIFPFFPFSVCDLGSQAVWFLIMATVPFLFLTAVKKMSDDCNLRKGRFILAHRFVTWSVWVRVPEAVGSIESVVRKAEENDCWCSPHFLLYIKFNSGAVAHGPVQ